MLPLGIRWTMPLNVADTNDMDSFDPLTSDAPLIVYIDYKSPYAFIAKDPTYTLADQLGVEVDWRPLTLDIPSYLGSARLDDEDRVVESDRTEEQWAAVKYAYRDARRYASLSGHTLRGTVKIWDTSTAHIGMLWAKSQGAAVLRGYTDRFYERFWRRQLDAEDRAVVRALLAEAGADVRGFDAYLDGEGRALHDAMQVEIFAAGIFGVPTYVVAGEAFFGREHLPMVRWLLAGKRGPAPDVAYRSFRPPDESAPRAQPRRPPKAAASGTLGEATPFRATLTVCVDVKNPWCLLALAPTRALVDELGVDVHWLPVVAPPLPPPPPVAPEEDRGTRHRRARSEYLARELERYASIQGLELRSPYRAPDSTLAAIALLWVEQRAPESVLDFLVAASQRYWRQELDIESFAAITALLAELGIDREGFDEYQATDREGGSGRGRIEQERLQVALQEARIFSAPAYVVGGEVFFGRQHLPMIRWLLDGQSGRSPI